MAIVADNDQAAADVNRLNQILNVTELFGR